jgi:Ni/Co efflux regulator RcnB
MSDRHLEETMRNITLAIAAMAAVGLAMPLATPPAKAQDAKIEIKTGDRDHGHDRRWHRDRDHRKVVIIKKRRHHDHD